MKYEYGSAFGGSDTPLTTASSPDAWPEEHFASYFHLVRRQVGEWRRRRMTQREAGKMSDSAVEIVIAAMESHRPNATQICIGCDWDGDYYQNPDGSGSQPEGAPIKHRAEAVIAALREAGWRGPTAMPGVSEEQP